MTYHLSRKDSDDVALCDEVDEEDVIVPWSEAHDPEGRHFNCPRCMWILGGERKRPEPS